MSLNLIPPTEVGSPIPANTPHAVSVTLPTWKSNIAYEEGEEWVASKLTSGYPRFFIHTFIQKLAGYIEDQYGREKEKCLIFPTYEVACRCRNFIRQYSKLTDVSLRILQLSTPKVESDSKNLLLLDKASTTFSAIFFPESEFYLAKAYWQHSGEGISSRMAEFCLDKFSQVKNDDCEHSHIPGSKCGGFHKPSTKNNILEYKSQDQNKESSTFLEERFGRNLDLSLAKDAEQALRRRIVSKINENSSASENSATEHDVYLYPSGMASIFNAHRITMKARNNTQKSVCFGFPYVDTRNILTKFGAGFHFYGQGDDHDLDKLEELMESGEQVLALFCEFPSNPLLKAPNLKRIYALASKYDFLVVVDETIGNFSNVHVLPFADIVVSSLTKVFSGDSNVMGGSLVLNPDGKYYDLLKTTLASEYENLLWPQDVIYLERNSRDFVERSSKINCTTEAVANLFQNNPLIKTVYYPKLNDSRKYYDACKKKDGGYGGLLSIIFHIPKHAQLFYDAVLTAKGPSLGTNFTLTSPYAILAHYCELDYISQFGVDRNLIRISVGLENQEDLCKTFQKALDVAATK
ncbi:uncharacterized protein SAPINGB_P003306 [Magnusiomyces paraingens]|uniref:cystathionine gamma-synthase n=1 Tax=Magnusiomyces paraingens TaxID=2606893 RepID=A0A5E8BRB7_9ASCO|nr:uncharacterized protein SAPINGB_P003306 [Saprochaete ingens]VVT52067.1 unnamed protein product [Saprochaete ingens]